VRHGNNPGDAPACRDNDTWYPTPCRPRRHCDGLCLQFSPMSPARTVTEPPTSWTTRPEATVDISGSSFAANAEVTVRVTRPDSSVVTGDGSFEPWPTSYDTVVADGEGDFHYYYILDGIPW